jgi:hypothetical protein
VALWKEGTDVKVCDRKLANVKKRKMAGNTRKCHCNLEMISKIQKDKGEFVKALHAQKECICIHCNQEVFPAKLRTGTSGTPRKYMRNAYRFLIGCLFGENSPQKPGPAKILASCSCQSLGFSKNMVARHHKFQPWCSVSRAQIYFLILAFPTPSQISHVHLYFVLIIVL